ncbi:MAG: multidrug effflux MFS transporter [Sphingomonadales bacterium]
MNNRTQPAAEQPWNGPGMREFIAMMAALMATNALATDAMLPALGAMGTALHVQEANQRQLVIICFLLGFGVAQLFYGPVSDHFGRKRILVFSLTCYTLFTLLVGLAASFPLLLAARTLQGFAAAGSRVLVISVIRDRFHGAAMARIMSMTTIVFMLVPVLAPSIGQGVLAVSGWRMIFFLLAAFTLAVLAWSSIRLPETLPPERRRPMSVVKIREAVALTLSHRQSIGSTLALTVIVGALFAFINSIQQIIFDVFKRPNSLAVMFAGIAGCMALSSYLNSRIVERFGARRVMIVGLHAFVAAATLHLAVTSLFGESLIRFIVLQALCMACFGLIAANLGSIAMQPLGHIAGTASSVQGVVTTVGGALIGMAIGQRFDGTTVPLVFGFALCGAVGLGLALWANPKEVAPVTRIA